MDLKDLEKHVNILGILHIVFGAIGILFAIGFFALFAGSGLLSGEEEAFFITATFGSIFACLIALFVIPGIIGGWGLRNHKSWARILILILSGLNILNFPLGTALGAYGFYVLMQDNASVLFSGNKSTY